MDRGQEKFGLAKRTKSKRETVGHVNISDRAREYEQESVPVPFATSDRNDCTVSNTTQTTDTNLSIHILRTYISSFYVDVVVSGFDSRLGPNQVPFKKAFQ